MEPVVLRNQPSPSMMLSPQQMFFFMSAILAVEYFYMLMGAHL